MLKINVPTLPEAGLKIDQEFSVDSLNERLASAPRSEGNPIEFVETIALDLTLTSVPNGMTTQGRIKAKCNQACSRCAETVCHPVNCDLQHLYKQITDPDAAVPEEDIGINYFKGDNVELGPVVEEALVLSLSPYWHPEDDAQGKCSHCKINYQEKKKPIKTGTQGLGDLLKKAGVQ